MGSNPTVTLDTPTFGASVELEFETFNDNSFDGTTFAVSSYAIQKVTVTCINNSTPLTYSNGSGAPAILHIYEVELTPDPTSYYLGVNSLGTLTVGYWRWVLGTQTAWLTDATTFVDPTYGTIGPNTDLSITIHE
jgi:hypothetical protein